MPNDGSHPADRDDILRLEEKIAFLERHVEQLDGVIRELFERNEEIDGELKRLRDDTERQFGSHDHSAEDDVPPHWGKKS